MYADIDGSRSIPVVVLVWLSQIIRPQSIYGWKWRLLQGVNTHVWIYKLDLITRLVWKSDNGHQAGNQIYPVFMTWLLEMN